MFHLLQINDFECYKNGSYTFQNQIQNFGWKNLTFILSKSTKYPAYRIDKNLDWKDHFMKWPINC